VYGASEVFVTGTFAGVTPVSSVDGREVGTDLFESWGQPQSLPGPITRRIQELYKEKIIRECGGL
jgi:branched-chain amino acid aminotransferase